MHYFFCSSSSFFILFLFFSCRHFELGPIQFFSLFFFSLSFNNNWMLYIYLLVFGWFSFRPFTFDIRNDRLKSLASFPMTDGILLYIYLNTKAIQAFVPLATTPEPNHTKLYTMYTCLKINIRLKRHCHGKCNFFVCMLNLFLCKLVTEKCVYYSFKLRFFCLIFL